jgi:hypothetical protein
VRLRRESSGSPEANATRGADGFLDIVRHFSARSSMVRTSVAQYFDIGDEGEEQGDQDFDAFWHEELVPLKATGIHTMTRPTAVNTARGGASSAPSGNGGAGGDGSGGSTGRSGAGAGDDGLMPPPPACDIGMSVDAGGSGHSGSYHAPCPIPSHTSSTASTSARDGSCVSGLSSESGRFPEAIATGGAGRGIAHRQEAHAACGAKPQTVPQQQQQQQREQLASNTFEPHAHKVEAVAAHIVCSNTARSSAASRRQQFALATGRPTGDSVDEGKVVVDAMDENACPGKPCSMPPARPRASSDDQVVGVPMPPGATHREVHVERGTFRVAHCTAR